MYSCLVIIKSILIIFLTILMFYPTFGFEMFGLKQRQKQDYCEITCRKRTQVFKHTMCVNHGCPIKGTCAKIQQTPLTADEKRFVLHMHNKVRNRIANGKVVKQPGAANMNQLIWDDELARIAQCWANACQFEHDQCRNLKNEQVGQNIGVFGSTKPMKKLKGRTNLGRIIQNWFKEVNLYNGTNVRRHVTNPKCGHYTQLAWATTTRVGCGQIFGFNKKGNRVFNRVYLYCNYAETGNWLREPVYLEGKPCSKCKTKKCSRKYKSLCTNPLKQRQKQKLKPKYSYNNNTSVNLV